MSSPSNDEVTRSKSLIAFLYSQSVLFVLLDNPLFNISWRAEGCERARPPLWFAIDIPTGALSGRPANQPAERTESQRVRAAMLPGAPPANDARRSDKPSDLRDAGSVSRGRRNVIVLLVQILWTISSLLAWLTASLLFFFFAK